MSFIECITWPFTRKCIILWRSRVDQDSHPVPTFRKAVLSLVIDLLSRENRIGASTLLKCTSTVNKHCVVSSSTQKYPPWFLCVIKKLCSTRFSLFGKHTGLMLTFINLRKGRGWGGEVGWACLIWKLKICLNCGKLFFWNFLSLEWIS